MSSSPSMTVDTKSEFSYWSSIRRRCFDPDSSFFAQGNIERELLAKQVALDISEDEKHQLHSMLDDDDDDDDDEDTGRVLRMCECVSVFQAEFILIAYLHILWNIGGLLTTLGSIGCIAWMLSTPTYEENMATEKANAQISDRNQEDNAFWFPPLWELLWPLVVSQEQPCWRGVESTCTCTVAENSDNRPLSGAMQLLHRQTDIYKQQPCCEK
ncbi:hypothetical protein ACFE04_025204 [Oxalis oulophora]